MHEADGAYAGDAGKTEPATFLIVLLGITAALKIQSTTVITSLCL